MDLAARNLANRADCAQALLRWRAGEGLDPQAGALLDELRHLRLETARAYRRLGSKPYRLAQQLDWLYGTTDAALELALSE